MSDAEIRALERAGDQDRLEREWIRRGLGWHGEVVPERLWARTERGVYALDWMGRLVGAADVPRMELVYVPGGEVECAWCRGTGIEPRSEALSYLPPNHKCLMEDCANGKRKIAPFYVGRYPVTRAEYGVLAGWETDRWLTPNHPVVNVSLDQARAFASWAGLRLPSEAEWKWAALGAPVLMDWAKHEATPNVRESGLIPRRYPWGQKPPSPERCVWAGRWDYGPRGRRGDGSDMDFAGGSTAPVVVEEKACPSCAKDSKPCGLAHGYPRLVPARPAGASWCGAMDLAGNVWEWLADGVHVVGGSFRTHGNNLETCFDDDTVAHAPQSDDVGFRIALCAAP